MRAIAPGKLILSGEHAVVYGCPAIAMAIDRSAQAQIETGHHDRVAFNLTDYQYDESFTLRALRDMRARIARDYHLFADGKLGIRDVLKKPVELLEYSFIMLMDGLHLKLDSGLVVTVRSSIPIGCGLGSSAAAVLSEIRALGHYFRVDFRPDWHYKYSMEAENLQHGHASGLDSYISLHGGCAVFQQGEARKLPLPGWPLFLVNTGTPATTTGECVAAVAERMGTSLIWDDFSGITFELESALAATDREGIQRVIRANHRLLEHIGVVPARVSQFIAAVEQAGGAAKICGAGSIVGDNAGMVLVVAKEPPLELCRAFGYAVTAVRGEPLGTRII